MGSMEQLHLRWNDFESNIKLGFSELRQDEDFYDVTLACESKQIKAHKVILSACSPFFRSLIKSVSHAHPLLYLRGIKFSHLEALLSFMYNGEVNVTQEELTEFLSIAEELKIRGLTQEGSSSSSSGTVVPKEETPTPPPNKRPRLNHKPASNAPSLIKPGSSRDPPEPISSDDIEILAPINAEHSQSLSQQSSSSKHAPPSYDTEFHEEKYIPEEEESANFLSRVEDGMEAEEDVDFLNSEEHSSSFTSDHPTPIAPMNENEASHESFGAEVHISKNGRGNDVLVDSKGHIYHKNKENKTNGRSYWNCARGRHGQEKCPARIHTILDPMDGEEIRIQKTTAFHNHPPSESALLKHSFYQDLKAVSLARPELSSSALVKEALGDMDEASISQLPPFYCLERNVRRWRKAHFTGEILS